MEENELAQSEEPMLEIAEVGRPSCVPDRRSGS